MKDALKAAIAASVSILLWSVGHILSYVMQNDVLSRLYPLYNRLMIWSCGIEEWAGVSIMWNKAK